MNIKSNAYRFLTIVGITFSLAACSDEGPMEQAGENVDEAVEDTQNAIEDSCENIKEHLDAKDEDC
ncbi:hypothetical protein FB440_101404 [Vibrio crassostreae]|uniref:hypothetical protein n=1 Tax=Vibrio TaxID=662 RepID=UPI000C822C7A|nr:MULTISPECIES: hypothetical protein [Vibrio]NOH74936.1 hypothetical protein [Vibrio crassostreae]NOI54845.1 hypothetical protein [Vibrio crassostreae]PMK02318.1 hypothetical protein BCU09_11825 [Vibrio cyclitrophicus]ROR19257.1 hypothetical protein EDB36_101401 [Vibrio crassostreae]ROR21164.1 hypothetical protein EDB67_11376 [Vibrio crassostreae]